MVQKVCFFDSQSWILGFLLWFLAPPSRFWKWALACWCSSGNMINISIDILQFPVFIESHLLVPQRPVKKGGGLQAWYDLDVNRFRVYIKLLSWLCSCRIIEKLRPTKSIILFLLLKLKQSYFILMPKMIFI